MLTHYYRRPPFLDAAKFSAFVVDVRNLLDALPPNITIRGREGIGEPEVNPAVVAFNGDAAIGAQHEAFIVEKRHPLRPPSRMREAVFFDFCKTSGKPYNLMVVATLYAFSHRFPECRFSTDATADQLHDGFEFYKRVIEPSGDMAILFEQSLIKD